MDVIFLSIGLSCVIAIISFLVEFIINRNKTSGLIALAFCLVSIVCITIGFAVAPKCPNCDTRNLSKYMFCEKCGTQIHEVDEDACQNCGRKNVDDNYCPTCGAKQ